jgi:hypothetical protein
VEQTKSSKNIMAPMILKVKPSLRDLREANIGSAESVAEAKSAKKRQKIVETEVYKISNNRSLPDRSRTSWAAAQAAKEGAGDRAVGSPMPAAVLSQYDLSDNDTGNEGANDNGIDNKAADNDILEHGHSDEEQVEGGAGARAKGAAYARPNEEAKATIGRTAAEEATDGEIGEDNNAGKGGHGLHHGMAGLEAAMAVPGSTAARFAECARANQATSEETATEHEAVCRSTVDDQAGALGAALGPKAATERT